MPTKPTIARIWRGRTRRDRADEYEDYSRKEGVPPLEKTALGVQLLREDRVVHHDFLLGRHRRDDSVYQGRPDQRTSPGPGSGNCCSSCPNALRSTAS